ncbi:hypothetical protein [Streptomyces sp. NBC_01185]|uniref:hypothetical protein n=1 Tax=Streptomyces sp. NBC_01185 TaxID=2903764 RepID=UPI003867FC69|nr:hypothetical protein OG770_36870 [Streptomyces sp. NBC_01185]
MMTNTKIGTALVGGYLLGRTKKAKVAIGLGMFLAGKKLSLDPQQLLKMASSSPLLAGLSDQVRTELVGATKTAASSALTKRVNHLSDSLHERAQGLTNPEAAADEVAETGKRAASASKAKGTKTLKSVTSAKGRGGDDAEESTGDSDGDRYDDPELEFDEDLDREEGEDEHLDDEGAEEYEEDDQEEAAARSRNASRSPQATKTAAKKTSAARRPSSGSSSPATRRSASGSAGASTSGARKKTTAKGSAAASSSAGSRRSAGRRQNGGDRG